MATINGTNGGDSLYGGAAADVINGLNGNDTLKGFGGADRLDGGNGIDTVFYGDSSAGVGINLATGRGVGGSAEGDTLISIENVFGSNFNDTLTGTSGANQLHGQDGNDVIKGGGGNDFLDGGNGNDILVSGIWDASTLDGGAGDDTFKGAGASDILIGGSGSDTADYSHMSFVTITLGDPIPYWAGTEIHMPSSSASKTSPAPLVRTSWSATARATYCAAWPARTISSAAAAPTSCTAAPTTIPITWTTPATSSGNMPAKARGLRHRQRELRPDGRLRDRAMQVDTALARRPST